MNFLQGTASCVENAVPMTLQMSLKTLFRKSPRDFNRLSLFLKKLLIIKNKPRKDIDFTIRLIFIIKYL